MLNSDSFIKTIQDLNLEGKQLDLAIAVWVRAEKAMLKEPLQTPVLTTPSLMQYYFDSFINPEPKELELSRSDLQKISALLKVTLDEIQVRKSQVKSSSAYAYSKAEEGTEWGSYYFRLLNDFRNEIKIHSKREKSLSEVQTKIKRILGSSEGQG